MENILEGFKREFVGPTGYKYTIREQNGADDDILSNELEARTLKNLSRFIASIVVNTDYTSNGRLTVDQAHNLPCLDKYCILFNSRIHSIGSELEFEFDWGSDNGGVLTYSQDLNGFLFDYSLDPTEDLLKSKPDAIPYYPNGKKIKDLEIVTSSGKRLLYDLLSGEGESYILNLPKEQNTKNKALIARNLRLEVNGKMEKVESFHVFSIKDMAEIRKEVQANDPIFNAITTIENPISNISTQVSIVGMRGFFYPGEI